MTHTTLEDRSHHWVTERPVSTQQVTSFQGLPPGVGTADDWPSPRWESRALSRRDGRRGNGGNGSASPHTSARGPRATRPASCVAALATRRRSGQSACPRPPCLSCGAENHNGGRIARGPRESSPREPRTAAGSDGLADKPSRITDRIQESPGIPAPVEPRGTRSGPRRWPRSPARRDHRRRCHSWRLLQRAGAGAVSRGLASIAPCRRRAPSG